MSSTSTVCSIHPYFKIRDGKERDVREYCQRFVEMTSTEPGCLYYGFTFNGNQVHTREAYDYAAAVLAHLGSVGELLGEMLETSADLERIEVHGPEIELAMLRKPLEAFGPHFYTLEYEHRR